MDINTEAFVKWLKGQKYVNIDNNSTEMTEQYEKEHQWELSRNSFIDTIFRRINDGDFEKSYDLERFGYDRKTPSGHILDNIQSARLKTIEMDRLVKLLEVVSHIQFPIEKDDERQFYHYTVNQIQDDIKLLKYHVSELENDLDKYEKKITKLDGGE